MRRWLLVAGLAALAMADLESCERARCVHCSVEFIAKMCPSTCAACASADRSPSKYAKTPEGQKVKAPAVAGVPLPPQPAPILRQAQFIQQVNPASETREGPKLSVGSTVPRTQLGVPQVQQAPIQTLGQAQYQQQVQVPQLPAVQGAPLPQAPQQGYLQQPAALPSQLPQFQQLATNQQQFPPTQNFQQNYAQGFQQQQAQYPQQQQQQYQQYQQYQPPQYQAPQPYPQPFQQQAYNQAGTPAPYSNQQINPFLPFQSQSGAFNPFQPFLQPAYQAASTPAPYNPFTQSPAAPPPAYQVQQYFTPAPFLQQSQSVQDSRPAAENVPPPPTPPPNIPTLGAQLPAQAVPVLAPQPESVYRTSGTSGAAYNVAPQVPVAPTTYTPPTTVAQPLPVPVPAPAIASSIDSSPNTAFASKQQCPRQPGWEPCISRELANERFRACCNRLGEGCVQFCSYDSSLGQIQIAVLTGRCPLAKVGDMMICASGYEDASPCCEAFGVFEPGYEHCRPYCNPAAGLPDASMLAEKYKCLQKLTQIQQCFYLTQRP